MFLCVTACLGLEIQSKCTARKTKGSSFLPATSICRKAWVTLDEGSSGQCGHVSLVVRSPLLEELPPAQAVVSALEGGGLHGWPGRSHPSSLAPVSWPEPCLYPGGDDGDPMGQESRAPSVLERTTPGAVLGQVEVGYVEGKACSAHMAVVKLGERV